MVVPWRWSNAMRVLVVEDEHLIRLMIAVTLSEAGHEVTDASDGASACRLICHQGRFDMLVTDY
jgi:two-component system chemotaxis response regulator CheY